MKSLMLALLILFTFSFSTDCSSSQMEKQMYELCVFMEKDCFQVTVPRLEENILAERFGYYGLYYPGDDVIFISPGLDPKFKRQVITHELAHYLHWYFEMGYSNCKSEEEARKIVSLIYNLPYNENWKEIPFYKQQCSEDNILNFIFH